MAREITNLVQLLDRIDKSADEQEDVSLGSIVEAVGSRSFGPLLLLAGMVIASPIGGIPGMPTSMGLLVLLVAGQMLFRKEHFWLPRWMLKRSTKRGKVYKALRHLRPVAHFVDRLLRPRLPLFIEGVSAYIVAIACAIIGICMPMMELIPFSAHGAGMALTAFGLSLIARDGLVALLAFIVTVITFGAVIYNMLT